MERAREKERGREQERGRERERERTWRLPSGRVAGSWSATLSPVCAPGNQPPGGVQASLKVDSALFACLDRGEKRAPRSRGAGPFWVGARARKFRLRKESRFLSRRRKRQCGTGGPSWAQQARKDTTLDDWSLTPPPTSDRWGGRCPRQHKEAPPDRRTPTHGSPSAVSPFSPRQNTGIQLPFSQRDALLIHQDRPEEPSYPSPRETPRGLCLLLPLGIQLPFSQRPVNFSPRQTQGRKHPPFPPISSNDFCSWTQQPLTWERLELTHRALPQQGVLKPQESRMLWLSPITQHRSCCLQHHHMGTVPLQFLFPDSTHSLSVCELVVARKLTTS